MLSLFFQMENFVPLSNANIENFHSPNQCQKDKQKAIPLRDG